MVCEFDYGKADRGTDLRSVHHFEEIIHSPDSKSSVPVNIQTKVKALECRPVVWGFEKHINQKSSNEDRRENVNEPYRNLLLSINVAH